MHTVQVDEAHTTLHNYWNLLSRCLNKNTKGDEDGPLMAIEDKNIIKTNTFFFFLKEQQVPV